MVNFKLLFVLMIITVVFSVSITMAFFEADMFTIIRNIAAAIVISVGIYIVWIKIDKSYEKFFRLGLGK